MKAFVTAMISLVSLLIEGQTFNARFGENSAEGSTINCRSACIHEDRIFLLLGENDGTSWKIGIYVADMSGDLVAYQLHDGYPAFSYPGWANGIHPLNDSTLVGFGWYASEALNSVFHGRIQIFDEEGNVIEEHLYGDGEHDHSFMHGIPTSDGGMVAVGTATLSPQNPKIYVVKADQDGEEEWHAYLGVGSAYREGYWVDELFGNSGFVICGYEMNSESAPVGIVYLIDDAGSMTDWNKFEAWSDFDDQGADGIISTSNNEFVFATTFNQVAVGSDFLGYAQLVKLNNQLDTIWTCRITPELLPTYGANTILELDDGSLVTVGTITRPEAEAQSEGFISKVSGDGELLWHRAYHYAEFGDNLLYDIEETEEGGFICSGWLNGFPAFGDTIPDQDAWVLALDNMGCLIPGCDTIDIHIREYNGVAVSVYPNPTNQFITLEFSKYLDSKNTEALITDLAGRIIKRIPIQDSRATTVIDCSSWDEGMYILSVLDSNRYHSEKITIVHDK